MNNKPFYKCAIVGCGDVAGGYDRQVNREWGLTHAFAYQLCPDTHLVAVAEWDGDVRKVFQERWKVERGYADYQQMLDKESIDILSITLPTGKHYEVFKYACKKNISAIFCEKPLSYYLAEARDMAKLSVGRVVVVNYFRRWNRDLAMLGEELASRTYGKITSVVARYTKGIMINGSHMIDLMRWFFGEPIDMKVISVHQPYVHDLCIDFQLTFPGGVRVVFLHVPDVRYVFIDVDILAERGRVVISQRGQQIIRYGVGQDQHYGFDVVIKESERRTRWENCITRAVENIVECLKNGGKPKCVPEDGVRALEICHSLIAQVDATVH